MADGIDRRTFQRIPLTDDAIAVDDTGRELGKVSQASGGGMTIHPPNREVADSLSLGQRLQVTVMEPGTQTSNTIDVVVRYHDGEKIGFEFVTGK
ncbi:MAG: hypothetical protein JWO20_1919 [Candidatus Angelobacter sp.]|nr:hypothetical protein [Candidatus Angelobacter sp.]